MLNRIVELSISHRFFVVLATLILILTGLYASLTLPIDAVPDITNKQVVVNMAAPALAPEEVERQITRPLEVSLSGIPGSTEMRSISSSDYLRSPWSLVTRPTSIALANWLEKGCRF